LSPTRRSSDLIGHSHGFSLPYICLIPCQRPPLSQRWERPHRFSIFQSIRQLSPLASKLHRVAFEPKGGVQPDSLMNPIAQTVDSYKNHRFPGIEPSKRWLIILAEIKTADGGRWTAG